MEDGFLVGGNVTPFREQRVGSALFEGACIGILLVAARGGQSASGEGKAGDEDGGETHDDCL